MRTITELVETFDRAFPFADALHYDNVGLIVGRKDEKVEKILLALDVTSSVIKEAKALGATLIVSHHPVVFREIKRITDETYTGSILLELIENKIAAIALHTNFDRAEEGNNRLLALSLGAKAYEVIEDGFATEFDLEKEEDMSAFTARVKEALGESAIRTIGTGAVKKVIASCGAGISEELILRAARTGAVIVTADVKHNYAEMAKDLGVRLVEPTHYASEWAFAKQIRNFLAENAADVACFISRHNTNPYG